MNLKTAKKKREEKYNLENLHPSCFFFCNELKVTSIYPTEYYLWTFNFINYVYYWQVREKEGKTFPSTYL